MSSVASGMARLSARNAAATKASVDPHLEPGEEALVLQPVRPKGGWASLLTFPRMELAPPAVELPESCTFAVTPRRFLVVTYPPAGAEPSRLVLTAPLDEVQSVANERALASRAVSWTAAGTKYTVWANPWMAKQIVAALEGKAPE